ncbi:MAG: polysaccharide biosynthesis/export family protein [Phycisphaerales bacterium]|nr:MAG: polysaccharide biosynthesis/export family protein [Phycisphaerales bacterium]
MARDLGVLNGRLILTAAALGLTIPIAGCNTLLNGWLDPSVVGNFSRSATTEIRASLTLEDTPSGIPGATFPTQEDLKLVIRDYSISPGDSLAIEINELRQRQVPYQAQVQISPTGDINLPVVGRVEAAGRTTSELEDVLRTTLAQKNVLLDPEVTVNALFLREAMYSIFGIGVSASNNAPLRAGSFPILHPQLRVLEAINNVGGLNEFVTDVYIFRYDEPESVYRRMMREAAEAELEERGAPSDEGEGADLADEIDTEIEERTEETGADFLERDLIDAVVTDGEEPVQEDDRDALIEALQPDPSQPYIWLDGEFVPNPAYADQSDETFAPQPPPPSMDTAIPTVNWARIAGDTTFRILRIPADLLRGGDPEVNIYVRAGDVIRIVSGEIGVYYVMGQVNRVGTYAFNAEPVTLKAAIAGAGGLSSLAWPDRCTVYRRLGQREQIIQVDLDRIFAGKDPDFFIKRGDIINVGTHPFAPFLQRIRQATLPNILSTVGYSFTYARNFADIDSYEVRRNPANEADAFEKFFQ